MRQVLRQQKKPGQMDRPAGELVEHTREALGQTRDSDPLQRAVLGIAEALDAVLVETRARLAEVELAPVHFREVRYHLHAGRAFRANGGG